MTHVLAIIVLVAVALLEIHSVEYDFKIKKLGLKKPLPSKGVLYYTLSVVFEVALIALAIYSL